MNWPLLGIWAFLIVAMGLAVYFTVKQVKLLGG